MQREQLAVMAMNDVLTYFKSGGQCAIYDATNSNLERREMVRKTMADSGVAYELIWIESVCDDPAIIDRNILDTKVCVCACVCCLRCLARSLCG